MLVEPHHMSPRPKHAKWLNTVPTLSAARSVLRCGCQEVLCAAWVVWAECRISQCDSLLAQISSVYSLCASQDYIKQVLNYSIQFVPFDLLQVRRRCDITALGLLLVASSAVITVILHCILVNWNSLSMTTWKLRYWRIKVCCTNESHGKCTL